MPGLHKRKLDELAIHSLLLYRRRQRREPLCLPRSWSLSNLIWSDSTRQNSPPRLRQVRYITLFVFSKPFPLGRPQALSKALAAASADAQMAQTRSAAALREALETQRVEHAAKLQEAYASVQATAQALAAASIVEARRSADEAREEAANLRLTIIELEKRLVVAAASDGRAAEERDRVAETKRLWKGVVDTMREETDALAVALEEAQVSFTWPA